jgi:hypothetical protein
MSRVPAGQSDRSTRSVSSANTHLEAEHPSVEGARLVPIVKRNLGDVRGMIPTINPSAGPGEAQTPSNDNGLLQRALTTSNQQALDSRWEIAPVSPSRLSDSALRLPHPRLTQRGGGPLDPASAPCSAGSTGACRGGRSGPFRSARPPPNPLTWGARAVAARYRAAGSGPDGTETRQPAVQGRSLSGLRTAQMCLIRSPARSNANTVMVTPSC